ncbi:MAG: hypothetical protein JNM93_03080 [Bacteriovoracaceae bacterium]|nr:hypothetical protein [Bacteriovoracaceae bacterium]
MYLRILSIIIIFELVVPMGAISQEMEGDWSVDWKDEFYSELKQQKKVKPEIKMKELAPKKAFKPKEDFGEEVYTESSQPATNPGKEQDQVVHIVQNGDELMLLSIQYYGTHRKWQQILNHNPELNPGDLKVGTKVVIPMGATAIPIAHKKFTKKEMDSGKIVFTTITGKTITIPVAGDKYQVVKEAAGQGTITFISKEGKQTVLPQAQVADRAPASAKPGKYDEYFEMKHPVGNGKISFISTNGDHVQFKVDDSGEQEAVIREALQKGRILYLSSNNKKYEFDFNSAEASRSPASFAAAENGGAVLDVKEDFEKLKEEYIKLKEKNVKLEEELVTNMENSDKLKDWNTERRLLKSEIDKLKEELAQKTDQSRKMESSPAYYMPSMLSYTDDQVMREKTQILNKKLWVYKNKDFNKCELHFPSTEANKEKSFREFVLYLNEQFGTDKVFGDAGEGRVIFELPGRAIYGVDAPGVSPNYQGVLAKISNFLEQLPVESIHFSGLTRFKRVQNDRGVYVDGDIFTMKQTMVLQDHFINELGWKPQVVSSGTMGFLESRGGNDKRFDVVVTFSQKPKEGRSIASTIAGTEVLRNITDEIYQRLSEPKYGKVMMTEDGLELHLARQYLFANDGLSLTDDGKKKLEIIMNMFSLVNDAKFQVAWVPGMLEKDEKKNENQALFGTYKLKRFLEENYAWSRDRIEIAYVKRQKNLVDTYEYADDTYNKRIIFKLMPLSISVRQLGDLK